MSTANKIELTDFQKKMLETVKKGYALSAAKRNFNAQEWRELNALVEGGLIRKTKGAPWNPAGAFVQLE